MRPLDRANLKIVALVLLLLVLLPGGSVLGAPVCARVKIEILQELAFERIAFDARLVMTNNTPDQNLESVSINLKITDETGAGAGQLFFVKVLSLDKIGGIDGTGIIPPQVAAEVHWILIPSPGAGGDIPLGKKYFVGGEVNFNIGGAPQIMSLMPAMITVRPQPELVLDYFLPREVWADDPFTDAVEPPIPFSLGVRTQNDGYGPAANLSISSGQPKIVENKQGLLIDFRLLGSAVNDQSVAPTLNLVMGNIQPQSCATGRWEMITTLSGKFIDFNASFTHASELGGTLTSLLKQVNTHFLTREMLVDSPGSDAIRDFLAYDDPAGNRVPDTIYTSDCRKLPVNAVTGETTGFPAPANPTVTLATGVMAGWVYAKVPDPAAGKLKLKGVSRSDGKQININNAWISEEKPTGKQADPSAFFLNIIDNDTTGSYSVTFETPAADVTAPVTAIIVEEPKYGTSPVYVSSATNFIFTATDDISGVASMLYGIDNGAEVPALPFNLQRVILPPAQLAGPHTISYHSIDRSGNREAVNSIAVYVDDAAPLITQFSATPAVITPAAPDASTISRQATLNVLATDAISRIAARYDIAAGSAANDGDFAQLSVIRAISATLTSGVAGTVVWNGRNDAGNLVPAGVYTVRVMATDQLGHGATAYAQITVNEFLAVRAVSPVAADQLNPSISGSRIVWQDFRNNKWDIFLYDLAGSSERRLTVGKTADQIKPVIDGNYVVWQDRSAGNWDVVLYDLATSTETVIAATLGDETNPVVKGNWVAWQSNAAGNQDIHLYNITTKEATRITNDPRDQISPVLSATHLVWEDYRNGLADIYAYELATGRETQITDNTDNQTRPTVQGDSVVWVDQRDGNRELYRYRFSDGKTERLTYTATDEAQPYLAGNNVVFADFAAGLADPNLSLLNLATKRTTNLIAEPHRQEQPRLDGSRLVWQDNRSGVWQIYVSEITLPATVATYPFSAGFNLPAVTGAMQSQFSSLFPLFADWKAKFGVRKIEAYDYANAQMVKAELDATGTLTGSDLALAENGALFVHAESGADISLGEVNSCGPLNLTTGFNMISFACLPDNYSAAALIRAIGPANVISISRFDNQAARWISSGVKNGAINGDDFPIRPGEGYLIYMNSAVSGWLP